MTSLSFMLKILISPKNSFNRFLCCGVKNNNILSLQKQEETNQGPKTNALQQTLSEDVSSVSPYFPQSFNLAAYVNNSESLQSLIKLNVNLSKIEKKPYVAEKLLKLNFEQNIKNHIFFLKDFIDADEMGNFITKNPLILCEPLEDLEVRISYLKSKCFSIGQIKQIVSKNPFWLMYSTQRIDKRLGFYQWKFKLSGNEVRQLSTKLPRIITYNLNHINTNTFVIKEEMGFEEEETKQLLLNKPKLWMINQKALLERFKYIHNVIKLTHSVILQIPGVLMCRNFKVKQRHLFLQKLGRAQFDPKKENYVPINALFEETDVEFCKKYAKCNIGDFNMFLKTL